MALNTIYMFRVPNFSQALSPEFQTCIRLLACPSILGITNNCFKLNVSKADLPTNPSNQLLLQGLPSQLIATLTFQLLKPKNVGSPLTFTLPSQPASDPSWNMVSHIFKIYPKFGHFSPALLLPTGLSCHVSVTWSIALASWLLSLLLHLFPAILHCLAKIMLSHVRQSPPLLLSERFNGPPSSGPLMPSLTSSYDFSTLHCHSYNILSTTHPRVFAQLFLLLAKPSQTSAWFISSSPGSVSKGILLMSLT